MDLNYVVMNGLCALSLLCLAAHLWRRGAFLLAPGWLPGAAGRRIPWLRGLFDTLLCQSGIPAASVGIGMGCLGMQGSALFALGGGAGILLPLVPLLSFQFAGFLGAAGLLLLMIPSRKTTLPRGAGFLLMSLCCVILFEMFAEKAASAAIITDYRIPSIDWLQCILSFLLGICLCSLLGSEGFALLVPGSLLCAGFFSVASYLFFAAGIFLGSFLRVLFLAWEWRDLADRLLGLIGIHRLITAVLCLVCAFTLFGPLTPTPIILFSVVCLAPLVSSVVLLPFNMRKKTEEKPVSFWHPLFRELPRVGLYMLRAEIIRLFIVNRRLFSAAMGSLLRPEAEDESDTAGARKKARATEKRVFAALDELAGNVPASESVRFYIALEKAASELHCVRAASERLLSLSGANLTVSDTSFLSALEEGTLKDFEAATGVFADETGSTELPPSVPSRRLGGVDPADPSDPVSAHADELCAVISGSVLTAGTVFMSP